MSLVSIARRPSHLVTSPAPSSRDGSILIEGLEQRRFSSSLSETVVLNTSSLLSADSSPGVAMVLSARSADVFLNNNNNDSVFALNSDEKCPSSDNIVLNHFHPPFEEPETISADSETVIEPPECQAQPQQLDQEQIIIPKEAISSPESQSLPASNYYTIKGAAVFLHSQLTNAAVVRPRTPVVKHDDSFFPSTSPSSSPVPINFYSPPTSPSNYLITTSNHDWSPTPSLQAAEISRHLGLMLGRLRDEDQIMMAAKLESSCANRARYLTLIYYSSNSLDHSSSSNECSNEESLPSLTALLGFDVTSSPAETNQQESEDAGETNHQERVSLGLVIPIHADMQIRLTGDGGFSISLSDRSYSFKPVAIQVMWACLHSVNEAITRAGRSIRSSCASSLLSSAWLSFYNQNIDSDPVAIVDWQIMDDVISRLPPADSESVIELQIRDQLRTLMSSIDLEEASSRTIRLSLEAAMGRDLSAYRQFIDEEMLVLLGQLDLPSEIYDYLYLGSEWNASDIRVLTRLGITHVVNVSREIDNFFPSQFRYFNVRVYDDESTELLRYWNSVYKFIETARRSNGRILVHCKMGVSRSAACVIAYSMKADSQSRDEAIDFVRSRRACVQPNKGFMDQLQVYEGILKASKVRHSDLFKHIDAMVAEVKHTPHLRPVSYHEETAESRCSDSLCMTYPGPTLGSRIAAFETQSCEQPVKQHGKHFRTRETMSTQERRLRNRTSPALTTSSTLEFPDGTNFRKPRTSLINTGSKEDLCSTASGSSLDTFYPESGHVRRVTAQLMTPLLSNTPSITTQRTPISATKFEEEEPNEARRSSTGLPADDAPRNSWPLWQRETVEMVCEK